MVQQAAGCGDRDRIKAKLQFMNHFIQPLHHRLDDAQAIKGSTPLTEDIDSNLEVIADFVQNLHEMMQQAQTFSVTVEPERLLAKLGDMAQFMLHAGLMPSAGPS